jgi:hypothetical protein
VTLIAFQLEMFGFELECALLVSLPREQGRLEAHFVVAGAAVCPCSAACKLAAMNVFVAIAAESVLDWSVEIVVLVALRAGAFGMLSVQRKFGFVVIKAAGREDRFPTRSRMATLAGALERRCLKGSAVRIRMTILAVGKGQPFIMGDGFAGLGAVTLQARDVLMESG